MLEANKSILFEKVFTIYNRNLLKRRFNSLQVEGFNNLLERNKEFPTIIYANHSSWWDGLVVFQIIRQTDLNFHVMMEENQLKDLQLFRKLGAFSVVRENSRSAVESVNYSSKLLKNKPDNLLLLFPQGKILANDIRPIKFYNGISRIIEKVGNCQVMCFSIRYEFLADFKPDIFITIGKPQLFENHNDFDSKEITEKFSDLQKAMLDRLKNKILVDELNKYEDFL